MELTATPETTDEQGNQYPLYNAAVDEPITENGNCTESMFPTHTVWSRKPCAESLEADFGGFISDSFANCAPPSIVGRHGCLKIVGTEQATHAGELLWDLEFSNWGAGGNGGSFSYVRWHSVADAQACSP